MTQDFHADATFKVTNLTLLDSQELYLRDFGESAVPSGEKQRSMIADMLDLHLFRKLA